MGHYIRGYCRAISKLHHGNYLADVMAEAFIAESVWLRVEKLSGMKDYDPAKLAIQRKMAQVFLFESIRKVRIAAESAIYSFASGTERGIMMWMLGRLTKTMLGRLTQIMPGRLTQTMPGRLT